MSNKQFEWTDTLVKEFHQWYEANKGKFEDHLREFKFQKLNGEKSDPPISPSPLFRTEDGVDIYEGGEMMYGVDRNWDTIKIPFSQFKSIDSWTVFAIPYNRDIYIRDNKPCLSYKDVFDAFEEADLPYMNSKIHKALFEKVTAKL
jgi:hypothetical protein